MTFPDGQNGEFEVPRCERKEEVSPDPALGWLRLIHTGSRGTNELCRPFRDFFKTRFNKIAIQGTPQMAVD